MRLEPCSILLGTTNRERLVAFYETALGGTAGAGGVSFENLHLVIENRDDVGSETSEPGRFILNLHTPDFVAAEAQLRAHGVTWISEPEDRTSGRFGTFTDPDGNHLQIIQFTGMSDPIEAGSDAASFVEKWTTMWRDHDGEKWPELIHEGGVLRNPLGDVSRADLPGYMAGLVEGITDHQIVPLRWGITTDGVLIEWLMTGRLGDVPLEVRGADRFILKAGIAVEGVAYFDPTPFIATPDTADADAFDLETFAHEYDLAWQSRDPEAISAKHAEDGTYQLHVAGLAQVRGRAAMRDAFAASLANWREVGFTFDRAFYGDSFYVWSSILSGILAHPLELGAITIPANGKRLSFRGTDVITVDEHGLISAKETHFDLVAAANQAIEG